MSISPKCDSCQKDLNDFWGILLSPPEWNDVQKFHICKNCYSNIIIQHKIKY